MNIHFAHAHIATSTADCDGPMHREYTVFVSDEAKAKSAACDGINDFWEIDFRNDVLTSQVSLTTVEFGLRMTATEDGFEWVQPTDEGYRSGEVRWCDEESCSPTYSQRDVFAEMMGY